MLKILFATMIIIILLAGCTGQQQSDTMAADVQNQVISEVQACMDELFADAEKLSTGALEKYLSDDPSHTFFMDATEYQKTALLEEVRAVYADYASQKITPLSFQIIALSPNSAIAKYLSQSKAVEKNGYEGELILSDTWVWQKTEGKWTAIHFDESWRE